MDVKESFQSEDISKTDFFDFVTAPDMNIQRGDNKFYHEESNDAARNLQPLQGFDQFWGPEKDSQRLETTIFDDQNKFYWMSQSSTLGPITTVKTENSDMQDSVQTSNTDSQVYTITVLNNTSNDQWLRKDIGPIIADTDGFDLDTILTPYPFVKTEDYMTCDGSTINEVKDEIKDEYTLPHFNEANQPQFTPISPSCLNTKLIKDPEDLILKNEWKIEDQHMKQETSESLLRSALQGKGYIKSSLSSTDLQNAQRNDLRKLLILNDQDTVLFADSTLPSSGIIDELPISSNNEFVEDMFLTLGPSFTEDIEKIKKIACEVQQFCTASSSDNSQDIPKIVIENNKTLQSGCYTLETTSDSSEIIIDNFNGKQNKQNIDLSDMNKQKYCGSKVTKKYKKVIFNNKRINADSFEISVDNKDNNNNSNSNINNNNNNDDNNDSNNNKIEKIQFGSTSNNKVKKSLNLPCNTSSNVTNSMGPRKERSLHYCSICSKGFKDKYSVNVHTRTHTGEKPFTCSLCGKCFRQKAHLAKHYQTHITQKNNSCGNNKVSKNAAVQQKNICLPNSTQQYFSA